MHDDFFTNVLLLKQVLMYHVQHTIDLQLIRLIHKKYEFDILIFIPVSECGHDCALG